MKNLQQEPQNAYGSPKARSIVRIRVGGIVATASIILLLAVSLCYALRPDAAAALTFFPAWTWGVLGTLSAPLVALRSRRQSLICYVAWFLFVAIYAEEPRSLLRGCVIWRPRAQRAEAVTVVSLNCAGGSIEAVREIAPLDPDIVLLQEIPSNADMKPYVQALFGGAGQVAYGPDTAIVVKGELQQVALPRPESHFITAARIRLQSGFEANVISIRLKPPVIDANLLSHVCWRNHTEDRKARRKQIGQIIEQMEQMPKGLPIVLGGDFNVGAGDGCLKALRSHLRDTFAKGGVGWGHTALNTVPLFRVDQIWASSELEPVCVYARTTKHSDHRMTVCRLTIPQ